MANLKDKPMPRNSGKGHRVGNRPMVVGLMIGLSVISYFDRTIMSIAGPEIMEEFRISATEMGAVYSAFILSYALLMIPGGRLADRFGPRRVLALSGLGAALFTGLSAFGARPGLGSFLGVIPAFVLIRLGLGVCTAPLYPSCARMNANWIPESRRARVQGLIASGAGLGGALSPLLFTWLIGALWLAILIPSVSGCHCGSGIAVVLFRGGSSHGVLRGCGQLNWFNRKRAPAASALELSLSALEAALDESQPGVTYAGLFRRVLL
jgi:MFS family permease